MFVRTLFVVSFLVGCSDKGDDSNGNGNGNGGETDDSNPPGGEDADNDGFDVTEDCNDGDPAINPDATEICDGVDNDCADGIDVGATDATDWWVDADVDGYGAGKPTASCTAIVGSVANGDDCDDANSLINPDAIEVCDDLDTDEDCDALIDDEDDSLDPKTATFLYPDTDKDTFGDSAAGIPTCEARAGYVADSTDCDDANNAVNPSVSEVCGDGVDNNCDTKGCGWSGTVDSTDADAGLIGEDYQFLGYDVAPAGDFNGDGVGDIIIGSSSVSTAWVFFGPAADASSSAAGATFTSPSGGGDSNGAENFPIGDQNGDGIDDVLVAAYNYNSTGAIFAIFGPVSGSTSSDTAASAVLYGSDSYGNFGWQPSAGDVSGDGVIDIMAPAPGGFGGAGGVYFFFGPVTGKLSTKDAGATFTGVTSGDWTGGANGSNGDVTGDGVDDLIISAEQTDYADYDDGVAYVFYGPVSGDYDMSSADVSIHGSDAGSHLGWINSLDGDVDGDGIDDVGVSAALVTAGDVWVLYAGTLSLGDVDTSKADAHLTGDSSGDEFGYSMDMGGDLNDDGFDDVAVTAPNHDSGNGAAYLFNGPLSGTVAATKADLIIGATGPQFLGASVMFVDDATDDGYDDLAVGSTSAYAGGTYRGAVSVWFGGGL